MNDLERRIASLEAALARLVRVAPLARVSSTGNGDQIEAEPRDEGVEPRAYSGQRFQHAGFKSTPVVDASARAVMVFARGGSKNGAIVAEDDGYDPGLAAGEAIVYSPAKHTCRVYFDKDGALTIESASAQVINITAGAGAKVKVNGGGRAVAAQGDTAGPYPLVTTGLFFETQ